jgi:hypothetical protein
VIETKISTYREALSDLEKGSYPHSQKEFYKNVQILKGALDRLEELERKEANNETKE